MTKLSIGLRLTLWYLAIFALAQVFFGAGMWLILDKTLYDEIDNTLENRVDDVKRFLGAQKKKNFTVSKLQEEVAEEYSIEHPGDYLQISDAEGNWIYRAPFLQQYALALIPPGRLQKPFRADQFLGGRPFRFLNQSVTVNGFSFTVQTGESTEHARNILARFREMLLLLAPVLLLGASAVGYGLSRRALAPVDALTRTARTITGSNLSRRLEPLHTGDELQRLSDTLNAMLARIETAFLRVTQFTADASHELRTPVSLIRTEAELALRRSRGGTEYREALDHILSEAERTSALIEELLALARADSGREALDLTRVNVSEALREVAAVWRRVASVRNLHFVINCHAEDLEVLADEAKLRRVLNVLLDNAFKYTPSPGTIEIGLQVVGDNAVIVVRDTGIGISEEDRPRIFERFYRAEKARSREVGGAGLGLAIAQWIVLQHQGSIKVDSTLGEGSVFRVELPLTNAAVHSRLAAG